MLRPTYTEGPIMETSQCNENDSLLHKKKLQSIKSGEDWLNMYYLLNNQAQKKNWIFFQERDWVCKTLHQCTTPTGSYHNTIFHHISVPKYFQSILILLSQILTTSILYARNEQFEYKQYLPLSVINF
jgi:hypothetical protein